MAMAPIVSLCYAICFLLVQIIAINALAIDETSVQHDNTTIFASKRNSGRSKRSLQLRMPDQLKIRVRCTMGVEIDLNWVKVHQFLANKHLPVHLSPHHLDPSVMEAVGEFVLYHDLETCSSVAYFERTQTFIGHIGMNYIINELPFKFDTTGNYPGVVGAPYVTRHLDIIVPVQPIEILPSSSFHIIEADSDNSSNHHSNTGIKRPSDTDPGSSTKLQRKDRKMANDNMSKSRKRRRNPSLRDYYLEILVFLSPDIAEMFRAFYSNDDYIAWIVKYCIRYFNAVDNIFQKMPKTVGFYINIAKVVILDNSKLLDSTNNGEIRFAETVAKLRKHLSENQRDYAPDSFDHIFMITSYQILHESVHVPGMTEYSANLYEKREKGQFYDAIPITVVEFGSKYTQAIHEISRTLEILTGPLFEMMEYREQYYDIIQESSRMCDRCFEWRNDNKNQFEEFFRENLNRCFLMNQPRSLRPPGPSKFLIPTEQCKCFGYHSHSAFLKKKYYVKSDECNTALQCIELIGGEPDARYIIPPFDGTPCGSAKKVCWNGECTAPVIQHCP